MKQIKKHSFIGATTDEAIKKAYATCGEDVIILQTKKIEDEIHGALYEIIVGVEIEEKNEETSLNISLDEEIDLSQMVRNKTTKPIQNSFSRQINENENKQRQSSVNKKSIAEHTEIDLLKKQLEEMNNNLLNVNSFLLKNDQNKVMDLPPEFLQIENLLQSMHIDNELHKLILKNMIKKVPAYLKNQKSLVAILYDILSNMVKIEDSKYSKITLFCGPTGVGKTTTIAKIAAKIKIAEPTAKVGVISLDNYKVGAFKQLEAYSEVLQLPLEIIDKPNQLIKAFHKLKNMDYIFIDTAGSSPFDLERIQKIEEFLTYHSKMNIEKVLVVAANMKYSDVKNTFINFNILDISSLIITKMDETIDYGDMFSFIFFSKTPLRNFGIGQSVPDDLRIAQSGFFVDLLVGRKKISHNDGEYKFNNLTKKG